MELSRVSHYVSVAVSILALIVTPIACYRNQEYLHDLVVKKFTIVADNPIFLSGLLTVLSALVGYVVKYYYRLFILPIYSSFRSSITINNTDSNYEVCETINTTNKHYFYWYDYIKHNIVLSLISIWSIMSRSC